MRAGTQSKNDQIGKEQNHEVQSGARQAIGAPHITQTYGKKNKTRTQEFKRWSKHAKTTLVQRGRLLREKFNP